MRTYDFLLVIQSNLSRTFSEIQLLIENANFPTWRIYSIYLSRVLP